MTINKIAMGNKFSYIRIVNYFYFNIVKEDKMLFMRSVVAVLLTATFGIRAFASEGMNISTEMLDNGLEIIVVENHTVPLVTIEICCIGMTK